MISGNSTYIKLHSPGKFSVDVTNAVKGVALLLLLFHHIGISPDLNVFVMGSKGMTLAEQAKVCVTIFVFLSGYGLFCSHRSNNIRGFKHNVFFSLKHLKKLYFIFGPIFIIFVAIGLIFNLRTLDVYGEYAFVKLLIDFMGLSNLFNMPTFNVTWGFMSLIILLYVLFPFLMQVCKRSSIVFSFLLVSFFAYYLIFPDRFFYPQLINYSFAFCSGMLFAKHYLFEKLKNDKYWLIELALLTFVFIPVCLLLRIKYNNSFTDLCFALAIIGWTYLLFNFVKPLKIFLVFTGKQSANIFMFHTFIFKYYFCSFFLLLSYGPIMYISLLVICLVISWFIEFCKMKIKAFIKKN